MSETDDKLLKERVGRMLDCCELSNVRVLDFSAKRFDEHTEPATAEISSDTSYLVNNEVFRNRYVWQATVRDSSAAPVAEVNATILVEYDIREGFDPDTEAAGVIANSTGYFAAYPYVRELFQSCTARLQIDPMALGLLLAGSIQPRGVTITRVSDYERPAAATAEDVGDLAPERAPSDSQ